MGSGARPKRTGERARDRVIAIIIVKLREREGERRRVSKREAENGKRERKEIRRGDG